eukprot:13239269-Ditylum_brightwellii.AAC.1
MLNIIGQISSNIGLGLVLYLMLGVNENIPKFLRRDFEALTEELRATGNDVGYSGDSRTKNFTDDTSDDGNRDLHEFDCLDTDDDMMLNNNNLDSDGASRDYKDLMNTSTSNYVRRQLGKSSTDGDSDVGRLHILLSQGGGRKLYAIDAIITTLTSEHNFNADNYKVCATIDKAATLIGGSNLHSHKEGFRLPVGGTSYSPLSNKSIEDQQKKCKNLKIALYG